MKKLLYSLLVAGLALTGCANFDDEASQEYAAGNDVAINVTATTDSTFTFTLTPGADTKYYSYVVVKGSVVDESISASTLLKGQYKGVVGNVVSAAANATYTESMRDAKTKAALGLPNTSYVIYAIAENDKGMTGNITSKVVSTSDGILPFVTKKSGDADKKVMTLTFDGPVTAGTGKVTAKYYQEYGGKFIDIPATGIVVTISGNVVTISTPDAPAGAIVLISWEEGAFVDAAGNKCAALESGLNSAGDGFTGINYQIKKVAFELPRVGFTDNGKLVSTLPGTANFDFNIYAKPEGKLTGDVSLIYKTATKVTTLALDTTQWSVNGKNLTFAIPEAPANGTFVGLTIKEGTILDDLGNPNQAVTTDSVYWNYMTKLTYRLTPHGTKGYYNFGNFTLSNGSQPGSVVFNNFYGATNPIGGYLDLANGKIYIENQAVIKAYSKTDESNVTTNYWILTYAAGNANYIPFTFDPSTDMFSSTTFRFVLADEALSEFVGYYFKPDATYFVPVAASTSSLKLTSSPRTLTKVASSLKGKTVPNRSFIH